MNPSEKSCLNWQLLALIASVYALSFFLPALSIPIRMDGQLVDADGRLLWTPMRLSGADAFRMAVENGMAPLARAGVVWFANPIIWLGAVLLALRKNVLAGIAGLVAVVLILGNYVLEELGSGDKAAHLAGYWLWFTSAALLSVVGFALSLRARMNREHAAPPDAG